MKKLSIFRSLVLSLLWLTLSACFGIGAALAAKYSAITYYFYYVQHNLFEPMVAADPAFSDPTLEGKLLYVTGLVTTPETVRDPIYGVSTTGPRLVRHISGIAQVEGTSTTLAPDNPSEAYLQPWVNSQSPLYIGCYKLQGDCINEISFRYALGNTPAVYSLPAELRDLSNYDTKDGFTMASANGFRYAIYFHAARDTVAPFIGRKQGNTLVSGPKEAWRMRFMETHHSTGAFKALQNLAFFLGMAWLITSVSVGCLLCGLHISRKPIVAALVSIPTVVGGMLGFLLYFMNKGALITSPNLDNPRSPVRRVFEQGCFDADRVATVLQLIWVGIGLCVVALIALAIGLVLRHRRAKKA